MRYTLPISIALFLASSAVGTASPRVQLEGRREARASRIQGEAPRIDGQLSDAAWAEGAWQGQFVQRYPYPDRPPSVPTEFKILYDDQMVYIGVRAWDSQPDSIKRLMARRDTDEGDGIVVELDSYMDRRTAFSFFVSAAGVKTDKILWNDGENHDYTWNPIWTAEIGQDGRGWYAEIAIPFNQLRFNAMAEHTWGLQVGRYLFRHDEYSFWQPVPRDAPGWVHQFGTLVGVAGIQPRRQMELTPFGVAQLERYQPDPDNPFAPGRGHRLAAGLDAKLGITNDITLDLTVLPDFGQVEADPSEVNLTAFETHFPEQRPFFVEGRSLFDFDLAIGDGNDEENLFYSRRIGRAPQGEPELHEPEHSHIPTHTDILGAIKLIGQSRNGLSFGALNATTSSERALIGANGHRRTQYVEPLTNYLLGVASKDFDGGNTRLRGIATSINRRIAAPELDFLHRAAYTGGIDFIHHWDNRNYYLNARTYLSHVEGSPEALLRTQTASNRFFQRPDARHVSVDSLRTRLTGHGGSFGVGKGGDGSWRYALTASWRSPGLELNDVGFVRGVDVIMQGLWVGFYQQRPFWAFRSLNVNLSQWSGHNFAGERAYLGTSFTVNAQLHSLWNLGGGVTLNAPGLSPSELRGGPSLRIEDGVSSWFYVSTDDREMVELSVNASRHLRACYTAYSVNPGIAVRPTDALTLELEGRIYSSVNRMQHVVNADWNGTTRHITASLSQRRHVLELRADYSITPELSLQLYARPFIARGQYSDFKRITSPRARRLEGRFARIDPSGLTLDPASRSYSVDENADGQPDYSFHNPNFNSRHFQSNLVVRWEYRPGSTLFLVWTQGRSAVDGDYSLPLNRSAEQLFGAYPHNVLLLKITYRIG